MLMLVGLARLIFPPAANYTQSISLGQWWAILLTAVVCVCVCVCSFLSERRGEEERNDVLAEITLKLEKHQEAFDQLRIQLEERHTQELSNQRSCMALSYREELLQVHTHQGFTVNL